LLHFLVRLACVRHAASVDSEPGSNSRLKPSRLPTGRRQACHLRRSKGRDGDHSHSAKNAVAYLVRSLGFHPSLPLTTGTFNLVVKELNRLPPERRAFSPVQTALAGLSPTGRIRDSPTQICLSSKPVQVTCSAPVLSTHCPHRISTAYPHWNRRQCSTFSYRL
jgi:hypothetical protein